MFSFSGGDIGLDEGSIFQALSKPLGTQTTVTETWKYRKGQPVKHVTVTTELSVSVADIAAILLMALGVVGVITGKKLVDMLRRAYQSEGRTDTMGQLSLALRLIRALRGGVEVL